MDKDIMYEIIFSSHTPIDIVKSGNWHKNTYNIFKYIHLFSQ